MKKLCFLSLDEKSYFVPGPKRGAIYDLKRNTLYSLDKNLASLFSWSLNGLPYQSALKKLKNGKNASSVIGEALKNLPFVRFRDNFKPLPSLNEILLKRNQDRQGVWLDITQGCNLRCVHCYAKAGKPLKNELSLKEWTGVIDQLFENGFKHITIGGGEPFFWPDIRSLLAYIVKKKPAELIVLTNATLLDDELLDFLSAHQIILNITIYSHLPEHHDQISKVKGSWEKTVAGIKGVVKRDISYNINIPIGSYNQNDLEKTLDFLTQIGVKRELAGGNVVYPLGRGRGCGNLPDNVTKFNVKKEHYQLFQTKEGKLLFQTCWCGKLLVNPQGKVSPCPSAREQKFFVGNIRKTPLKKLVAKKALHNLWGLTLDDVAACRDCEFRFACHDCRANAYVYSGNLLEKNPYCLYEPKKGTWMKVGKKNLDHIKEGRWIKSKNYKTHTIEKDLAILNEETNAIYILNQVGAEIYNLLDGKHSFDEIVTYIFQRYEADEEKVKADALNILQELYELGIIADAHK